MKPIFSKAKKLKNQKANKPPNYKLISLMNTDETIHKNIAKQILAYINKIIHQDQVEFFLEMLEGSTYIKCNNLSKWT